jgi:dTDP-4-amino-4,6-dideoxygalactose transaminase
MSIYLPDKQKFVELINRVWESGQVTNFGRLHEQLEIALAGDLGVRSATLMSNGTVTLFSLLKQHPPGEIITTPFTYIATINAIIEAGHTPIYCDIDDHGNLCPDGCRGAITERTRAILPVHVYGNHCDVKSFDIISNQFSVPIYYDAAHAILGKHNGRSILTYGNASSVSLHATKTISACEGGAIFTEDQKIIDFVDKYRNFGYNHDKTSVSNGLNFKLSELHAAYGLVSLSEASTNLEIRRNIIKRISSALKSEYRLLINFNQQQHTFSYFPILSSVHHPMDIMSKLHDLDIAGRRYFYPLTTKQTGSKSQQCKNAEYISENVVCVNIVDLLSKEDKFMSVFC